MSTITGRTGDEGHHVVVAPGHGARRHLGDHAGGEADRRELRVRRGVRPVRATAPRSPPGCAPAAATKAASSAMIEGIGQRAHAEEDVGGALAEGAGARPRAAGSPSCRQGPSRRRRTARSCPRAGSKVARPSGPNTLTSRPVTSLPNSQSENLPPGLLLDHQPEAAGVGRKVDHRVGAAADHVGRLQHHELAGIEGHGPGQHEIEIQHVVHEPAHVLDAAGAMGRQGLGLGVGRDLGRHAQRAVGGRARLAHQDVALVALELGEARRLAPLDMRGAGDDRGRGRCRRCRWRTRRAGPGPARGRRGECAHPPRRRSRRCRSWTRW